MATNSTKTSLPWETLQEGNKSFADKFAKEKPELLATLSKKQEPQALWIGCSDSRCPETTLLAANPGDVFVHRNIANVVTVDDPSVNSVITFAVWKVGVSHVIVCGHTSCGGATASLGDINGLGEPLAGWLAPVKALREKIQDQLTDPATAADIVAKENVKMSLEAVKQNPKVKEALASGKLQVHGAMYDVRTGKLEVISS